MEALSELVRPWKLATLAMGIALLIVGRFYYQAPDWDVPISVIMALVAYATASWSMRCESGCPMLTAAGSEASRARRSA